MAWWGKRLYSVWQRYNFESNLQLQPKDYQRKESCIQYDKDTILKAIYNITQQRINIKQLYSVWQRYNFESNLQRVAGVGQRRLCCIQYDKDTILKAIYNRFLRAQNVPYAVFSMTKIQFWKQFTTFKTHVWSKVKLYSVWQRYNFESNLQPFRNKLYICVCCIQYDKDTILKAIYNKSFIIMNLKGLYSVWQRYNFESNLQL